MSVQKQKELIKIRVDNEFLANKNKIDKNKTKSIWL